MMLPNDAFVNIGLNIHVREWGLENAKTPFLLVHGLASNAQTWDGVAQTLAQAGHPVVAIDQRGHGLSDKPDSGFDFDTITNDIVRLIEALGWHEPTRPADRPILVGQSWGGNVMLAFGVNHPTVASRLIFVDGGFFDLQMRSADWETTKRTLAPPNLLGTPLENMRSWMKTNHPDWSEAGINGQLANFELLKDGTVRPHLTIERHLQILHAMWLQRPSELFPFVHEPVLIAVAGEQGEDAVKDAMVQAADNKIADVSVKWFPNTAHDIHVHRPKQLAQLFLDWINSKA